MKILFLRTDFFGHADYGGSFTHIKGFLDGMTELGHSYAVLASGPLPVDRHAPFYRVPYSRLYRNLPEVLSIAYNDRVIKQARTIIEKERPDFIYHRHSEFNFASSLLAKEFGIPLVLEYNGSEVWIKKNWGRIYLESLCRSAEEVQLRSARIIAVVSKVIKEDLIQRGIRSDKIIVNPNGVDPGKFYPEIDGNSIRTQYGLTGKLVAGFVGTFGAWHGVDVLARAIKPTIQRQSDVHFLIVGDGTLRGEVERIIRDDNVLPYVTLTGSVPHDAIPKYLAACDVLLSPHVQNADGSTFFGSPTKLFEYLGMGKPIIASGVGQIGEIMNDGRNCLLMKHRDYNDLADKIVFLINQPSLCRELGAAARKDAVEKFSWRKNAERVIEAVRPFLKSDALEG
jgi:glycosyltransferase involved in cell wall biosynthesis